MQIEFFNFFRSVVQTEDGLVLYALALIVSMEIIDFVTGTIAAIVNRREIGRASCRERV